MSSPLTDRRIRAEALWEELGGDLCVCQRVDVPHWCEKCQVRIDLIETAFARLQGPAGGARGEAETTAPERDARAPQSTGTSFIARRGVLMVDGWGGRTYQPVIVEGETPKRYRVRAVGDKLRLPSRGNGVRWVLRSGTALVPKHAIRFEGDEAPRS